MAIEMLEEIERGKVSIRRKTSLINKAKKRSMLINKREKSQRARRKWKRRLWRITKVIFV